MKILFISMHSIHAIRWIENLKESQHELYWFDVLGRGKLEAIDGVTQFTNWKQRKRPYIKGEYFLSKKVPLFFNILQPFLEITANEKLEEIIKDIQPDVVHSFEMQSCSYPILKTINKFSTVKWIYSCWGNDLYYYKNFKNHELKIRDVLKRVNYLHTDCDRDFRLAQELGFLGKHLGVIPGGTGYKIDALIKYKKPINKRKIILIKGYQHIFGRALYVVKVMENIYLNYPDFEIIVFGAHQEIISYIGQKQLPFKVYDRNGLSQNELLKLMGQSLLYIGNNISDGMPNTLLEAIVMGAFPIQSNPGNATSEIIEDGINGFLIQDAENSKEIESTIQKALADKSLIEKAYIINITLAIQKLDYERNKVKINSLYNTVLLCE
ncbi:glycosyltransferase [Flavobacterium sp. LB1P62]|uniref:glycosyltransferase n=1 Tax=Flavobacterium sp. LB1P62 TaxID=3401715 RepID=UPI003AAB7A5A